MFALMVLELRGRPKIFRRRWCEGDKAFPLKKRRGNFERSKEETTVAKDKKMKTKMNKKCLQRNGDQEEEEDMVTKEGIDAGNTSSGKRRVRGSVLMEGSQCSRVNGRGWRCCQQTLVGYSLCEHHLGKGRLRSMTSVRSRTMGSATASNKAISSQPLPSTSLPSEDKEQKHLFPGNKLGGEGEEEEDDKNHRWSQRRKKLGIVKARSIRCLLGQANNAIAVAENNK
ncbi:hypothetical protein GH714_036631 [Hevea brasiliensis]|uniref:WRC domain-containing protein n=1 Tax=Hevea brasiliensis TaxID=3981 RepID=A0A6A6KKN6_HEVBR|nr:hypothetical protein GH714_036631 [Hevea brasiliensis]